MPNPSSTLRVRLPITVKEWLVAEAANNMRSMSAEVALALKEKMQRETGQSNEIE